MIGARRAVACRVGATVVDGRKMWATADDRGQQCKLETIENILNIIKAIIRITWGIDAFARTIQLYMYRTLQNTVQYFAYYELKGSNDHEI